jgi:hypothetical protein
MRIFKELNVIGFFKWYCTQYGGLNYTEYKEFYDHLPLDNIITTELNACIFKFFREEYKLFGYISKENQYEFPFCWNIQEDIVQEEIKDYLIDGLKWETGFSSHEEAELDCIKKLLEIVKSNK